MKVKNYAGCSVIPQCVLQRLTFNIALLNEIEKVQRIQNSGGGELQRHCDHSGGVYRLYRCRI